MQTDNSHSWEFSLVKRPEKETCDFKEPTNRSHPIWCMLSILRITYALLFYWRDAFTLENSRIDTTNSFHDVSGLFSESQILSYLIEQTHRHLKILKWQYTLPPLCIWTILRITNTLLLFDWRDPFIIGKTHSQVTWPTPSIMYIYYSQNHENSPVQLERLVHNWQESNNNWQDLTTTTCDMTHSLHHLPLHNRK